MDQQDVQRIDAFVRWTEDATASRTEPFQWGTALFHDAFPMRYDSNFLRVERSLGDATAADLAREAERLLAEFAHREVVVPDASEADRLAAGMVEQGYAVERLTYMIHRSEAPPEPSDVRVEEFDLEAVHPLFVEQARRYDDAPAEEVAVRLADFAGVLAERLGARFFGASVDGTPVGSCDLYVRDGVAQVENVGTLEEHRGRGLARAFVTRAVREAYAAGAELVFLMADDDDWPKAFYGRLGFERVGGFRQFNRFPTGGGGSTVAG
jgi:ribosomal protein S18 acetylase RimI-like enzyme